MKLLFVTPIILAISLTANIAQAQMLDLSFQRITNNNIENIENQLGASVYDKAQALTDFNAIMANDEVLFTFTNSADVKSNIGKIYFDDVKPKNGEINSDDVTIFSQTSIINSLGGFTNYTDGGKKGVKPKNLPSGNTVFEATADFGAVTKSNPKNGVNSSNDILGIIIKLQSGLGFGDLQQSLNKGTLRLGLHVRSIGIDGDSDSFINNPFNADLDPSLVPIPAAMWLFGPALLVLTGVIRRKSV